MGSQHGRSHTVSDAEPAIRSRWRRPICVAAISARWRSAVWDLPRAPLSGGVMLQAFGGPLTFLLTALVTLLAAFSYWQSSRHRAAGTRLIRDALFRLVELQRRAVHAIALACRPRSVRKDVAEMTAAFGAMHFGADHRAWLLVGRGINRAVAAACRSSASRCRFRTWCRTRTAVSHSPRRNRRPYAFHCSTGSSRRAQCRAGAARGTARA